MVDVLRWIIISTKIHDLNIAFCYSYAKSIDLIESFDRNRSITFQEAKKLSYKKYHKLTLCQFTLFAYCGYVYRYTDSEIVGRLGFELNEFLFREEMGLFVCYDSKHIALLN